MTLLTSAQLQLLIALDRPRSRDAIAPELRGDADWLVRSGFVIDHEDKLVGVVVRPAQDRVERPVRQTAVVFA